MVFEILHLPLCKAGGPSPPIPLSNSPILIPCALTFTTCLTAAASMHACTVQYILSGARSLMRHIEKQSKANAIIVLMWSLCLLLFSFMGFALLVAAMPIALIYQLLSSSLVSFKNLHSWCPPYAYQPNTPQTTPRTKAMRADNPGTLSPMYRISLEMPMARLTMTKSSYGFVHC